jgi:hypothetical protein
MSFSSAEFTSLDNWKLSPYKRRDYIIKAVNYLENNHPVGKFLEEEYLFNKFHECFNFLLFF